MRNASVAGLVLIMCFGMKGFALGQPDLGMLIEGDHEVKVEEVQVRLIANSPVVLLRVGEKAIPIFVDPTVAGSIQSALTGEKFPRPLSHELMFHILGAYEVKVDRVFITLREGVYYGTLTLSQNGHLKLFDSRSSDAIALAVHFQSPIMVQKSLLDSVGKLLEGSQDTRQLDL